MVTEVETVERLPWEEPDTVAQAMAHNDPIADEQHEMAVQYAVLDDRGETAMTVIPDQQHLVVGVGALAAMDEASFQRNIANLVQGQARLEVLTDKLLVHGQDYGKVPGIKKPFLQKPGAEKLGMFYGLAVRFEVDRLVGDGISAPQLAYHVRAYAHLRDFSGPVVAQGFGESNSWEERYRWRAATPTCPNCGREGLIKRKTPPNLAGKWNCPNFADKGGCNSVFEPNDERISAGGRVENTDPWGLANTLVKMGEKRAHVDVILRATGTSGFFSQDEDSPAVQPQPDAFGDDGEAPKVENVPTVKAAAGGKQEHASNVQLRELVELSKEKELGPEGIAALMKRVLGKTVGDSTAEVSTAARALTGDEIGKLLNAIRTGEVPEDPSTPPESTTTSGTPSTATTPGATSTGGEPAKPPAPVSLGYSKVGASATADEPAKPRRGRPPGSKNKPKVVEEFVVDSEATPGFPPQSSDEM